MISHKQLAIDAVELVTPAIERLFDRTNRKELHIVIMDPTIKPWESRFEDAILYQSSLGNPGNGLFHLINWLEKSTSSMARGLCKYESSNIASNVVASW